MQVLLKHRFNPDTGAGLGNADEISGAVAQLFGGTRQLWSLRQQRRKKVARTYFNGKIKKKKKTEKNGLENLE